MIAARAALATAYVAGLLARYDQQVTNGLRVYPVRPPEPGCKGRTKQHPATNLLLQLRDYKTEVWRVLTDSGGSSSSIGGVPSITIWQNDGCARSKSS